jgi:neutral ceramidase
MALRLGTATVDITPQKPVELSGFAGRVGPFTAVRAPLEAQVFALDAAVLVCADLLWWGPDLYADVVERIEQRYGVAKENVVLHASHTHCGPQPGATFSALVGAYDVDYLAYLADVVVEAVGTALGNQEPVNVQRGKGECSFGMNRRLLHPGGGVGGPNPDGPKDSEVTVLRFVKEDGDAKAVLVHYTCHPVVSNENKVGPDFPGAMRAQLQPSVGAAVIGFLQGCCGDQDPAFDGEFRRGGDEDIADLGAQLAVGARQALGDLEDVATGQVSVRTTLTDLPLDTPATADLEAGKDREGIWGDWSRTLLADPRLVVDSLPARLTLLTIADSLVLLGFNAEVTVNYGHYTKARGALPIPYTNGMVGYIVTAEELEQGGYEPNDSYPYVYRSGRWKPEVEPLLKQAIDDLLA